MYSASSAGSAPSQNIQRQPSAAKQSRHNRGEQIADGVSALQDAAESTPRHFCGAASIASDAPTPHSPPMPMPYSARRIRNTV